MKTIHKKFITKAGILTFLLSFALAGCSSSSILKEKRSFGHGDITLLIPAQLLVRKVDGKSINVADFRDGNYTIKLSRGKHAIVFEYIENWNRVTDFGNIMRSPAILLTHNFNSNDPYMLSFKRPTNEEEARILAKRPKFWLEQNGRVIKAGVVDKTILLHESY